MSASEGPCPIGNAIEAVTGRWKGKIIWWLKEKPQRFGEVRRLIPKVSPKVLTQHLRQLERDGLVNREYFAEIPPRVEYSLTPLGHSVVPVLDALADWWREHGKEVEQARAQHEQDSK